MTTTSQLTPLVSPHHLGHQTHPYHHHSTHHHHLQPPPIPPPPSTHFASQLPPPPPPHSYSNHLVGHHPGLLSHLSQQQAHFHGQSNGLLQTHHSIQNEDTQSTHSSSDTTTTPATNHTGMASMTNHNNSYHVLHDNNSETGMFFQLDSLVDYQLIVHIDKQAHTMMRALR